MPIYAYHCADCATDFELLVRGDTAIACPKCAGRDLERRLSLPARPSSGAKGGADYSSLGPPAGGGCCGGSCGCH